MSSAERLWRVFVYLGGEEGLEDAAPCSESLEKSGAQDLLFALVDYSELAFGEDDHYDATFFLKANCIQEYDFLDEEEKKQLGAADFDPVREGKSNGVYIDCIEDCYVLFDEYFGCNDEDRARALTLLASDHPVLYAYMY